MRNCFSVTPAAVRCAALSAAVMLVMACPSAQAGLAAAGLDLNGNPNPQTGIPFWYMDNAGTTLELNLHPTLGISTPPIVGNAYSQQIGYGDEAFFWSCETSMPTSGGSSLLVLALEAAFASATGAPEPGQHIVFSRTRIRVDVTTAGTYTVIHPFGQETFVVDTPGTRAINFSNDFGVIPQDFKTVLGTANSVFLKWDADLPIKDANGADYIGSPITPHRVTGSPTGFNKFRIEGPNIGGAGVNFVETDLFTVTGKVATNPGITTPLAVERATYRRSATGSGEVNVLATSLTNAAGTITGGANLPTTPTPMVNDGTAGRLVGTVKLADATVLPIVVSVTVVSGGLGPTTINQPLVDEVLISKAEFYRDAGQLTVMAASSDLWGALPTLTAGVTSLGNTITLGTLTGGELNLPMNAPPPNVTVTSAKGGTATAPVIIKGPLPPKITPPTSAVTASAGAPFSYIVSITGGQPMTVTATGLPPRLTMDASGVLSGNAIMVGTFNVMIIATNESGTDIKTMTLVFAEPDISGPNQSSADTDQDGFPDEMEIALGKNRYDPLSTPANDQPAGTIGAAGVTKLGIKLNFAKPNPASDSISLSGALAVPGGSLEGQIVIVDVGGAIRDSVLLAKGSSVDKLIKVSTKGGKYAVRMKGSFAAALANEGLVNETISGPFTVPVFIVIGSSVFSEQRTVQYKATQGKAGLAK